MTGGAKFCINTRDTPFSSQFRNVRPTELHNNNTFRIPLRALRTPSLTVSSGPLYGFFPAMPL